MPEDFKAPKGEEKFPGIARVPVDGVIDLHAFKPCDVSSVVEEYINACREQGVFEVRIIHGKGKGVLRDTVRKRLARMPTVRGFRNSDESGGGWGATVVDLVK
ncbi:MAG: Smr/MutS family protein [Deltaproteobacteria bacterium]|nr:Smr/MutS family protein [Deltaproteobacteria bacterium]